MRGVWSAASDRVAESVHALLRTRSTEARNLQALRPAAADLREGRMQTMPRCAVSRFSMTIATMFSRELVERRLERSLARLVEHDIWLMKTKSAERAVSHRLAVYL